MSADSELDLLGPYRGLLFSIAYRMVGEVGDAEDIVQEAYLRAHRVLSGGGEIHEPKAFLTEVTTRLAIEHLRSTRGLVRWVIVRDSRRDRTRRIAR